MLGTMLPSSFKYAYLGGLWSVDPAVSNPVFATESYQRALYGAASTDSSISPEDKYSARVEYTKALAAIGNYSVNLLSNSIATVKTDSSSVIIGRPCHSTMGRTEQQDVDIKNRGPNAALDNDTVTYGSDSTIIQVSLE